MADTTLDIGVRGGSEGKAIVDLVTKALIALGQANAANARQTKQSAEAAKSQASTLAGVAKASQDSVANQIKLLDTLKRAEQATAASSRVARDEAVDAAQKYAKATVEAAKYFQTIAAGRLREAQKGVTLTLPSGATATTISGPLVAARRRELAAANEDLARARALGNQQIKIAQEVGSAETRSARQRVVAQNAVLQQTRLTAAANVQAARQAQQRAAAEENAARRAQIALQRQGQAANALSAAQNALRNTVLRLVAAYSGFRAIEGFVAAGIKFNTIIESSKLGIGALITAEADLVDKNGHLLTGTNALAAAQILAKGQLDKLRIAGIQTAATTEQLVTSFQEAVGAGVSVGLTLDQIRQFTVQVAQAATTINLPFSQLNQEVRSILQGTIDRNSRIAKALQLTNAQVNQAKEQGRLADLLNEKFSAFNVAGVASVKTFAALRSNIQDAFSVLSGAAVEPLFQQIRDAGQAALAAVFDFKTASIQKSFLGLVAGAQVVFREIGRTLSDAIAFGVEKARALSDFFAKNKEEVKQTVAAIDTMVRTFGQMLSAIVEGISSLVTFGGHVNAITASARLLNTVFETIRDTAGTIITLLTARALITAIGAIVGAVTALSTGAAIVSASTGIGALIALVLGASFAYRLLTKDQQAARLEAARLTTVTQDQTRATGDLVARYVELRRQLEDTALSDEERKTLQSQLNDLIKEFNEKAGPQYKKIIDDTSLSINAQKEALVGLLRAQTDAAAATEADARSRVAALQKELDTLLKRGKILESQSTGRFGLVTKLVNAEDSKDVKAITAALRVAQAEVATLTGQTDALTESLKRASETPPIIKKKPTTATGVGDDPRIKQAQAELDRAKAELDAKRQQSAAQLAERVITAKQNIQNLLDFDLAEIAAEQKFLTAQIVEAERKRNEVVKGEKPSATARRQATQDDVLRGLQIQNDVFEAKRVQARAEANAQIARLDREQADKTAQLNIDVLKAQGKLVEAAAAESALRARRLLSDFDDENGQLLAHLEERLATLKKGGASLIDITDIQHQIDVLKDIKVKITFVADQQSLQDQLAAAKTAIQQILETRTAQEQDVRTQFDLGRKLTIQEQQSLRDALVKINNQAASDLRDLRVELEKLRTEASLKGLDTSGFDALIAKIDAVGRKTKDINIEMEKFKAGVRDSLESGISGFFESLGDKTKTLAEDFKNMVTSIIHDIQRLVSQLLAQKIVQALFGAVLSAAGGVGRSGNQTQSGFGPRAEGGPAGPRYGRLRGGIPGVDSIPILAQQDEWFLRPAVRRKYGDQYLKMLNDLTLPVMPLLPRQQIIYQQTRHFAQGGPVNAPTTARQDIVQDVHVTVGVDRHGLLDVWTGPVGRKVVTDHVKSSHRELGPILQGRRLRP